MELDNIIYSLYVLPLIFCFRAFQIGSENYDQLPEKIPMHFNIKGKADQWWGKNRFSIYLIPSIGIFTLLVMGGIALLLYRESGPLPDDFNLALVFFTFSIVYLLYETQKGIIQYSLKQIDNVWPAIKKGTILLVVSCVLLTATPFILTKPTILDAVTCARLENKTPMDERDRFSMEDGHIILFLKLQNIKGAHLIRMEWIDPDDKEYFAYENYTPRKVFAKYQDLWSYISVKENKESVNPGTWRVDIFIDKEKVLSRFFSISEKGDVHEKRTENPDTDGR